MKQVLKSVGWVAFNFILQMIVQSVFIMPSISPEMTAPQINDYIMGNILLVSLISNIILIAVMIIVGKIKRPDLKTRWSISKPDWKNTVFPMFSAFLFTLGLCCATDGTELGNSNLILKSVDYFSGKVPFLGVMMMIINLLILAPIAEEIMCRGIMVNELKTKFSPVISMVISAVIFGAMHIVAGGFYLVITAAVMGLIFGLTYIKTGSLISAIIVHAAANIPDFIFMVLPTMEGILKVVLTAVCFLGSAFVLEIWCGNVLQIKGKGNETDN